MFCTSLRQRASFAPAIPKMLKAPLSLQESQLKTHDLEVPIKKGVESRAGCKSPAQPLRVLLFSHAAVSDGKLHETLLRIQRFASLTAGEDLLILFLLNPPRASSFMSAKELATENPNDMAHEDAIAAYSKLQAELINQVDLPYLPIRPIMTLEDLSNAIEKHSSALMVEARKRKPTATPFELLQLCTANPPMPDHTAFILSDIFSNLHDLASACSTISSVPNSSSPSARAAETQLSRTCDFDFHISTQSTDSSSAGKLKRLRDLVGSQECQDIIDFWKEEWLLQ